VTLINADTSRPPRFALWARVPSLQEAGLPRAAATLELAREFCVRREEAVKANLDRWAREAACHDQHGNSSVSVQEGTKGGRDVDRWIPVGEAHRQALANALAARPAGSANLIAPHETYAQLAISRGGEITQGRDILKYHGLPGYHDSRAAYACERYEQITGLPAPAVAGERLAPKDDDLKARLAISKELGHGRVDVLVSYVGSVKGHQKVTPWGLQPRFQAIKRFGALRDRVGRPAALAQITFDVVPADTELIGDALSAPATGLQAQHGGVILRALHRFPSYLSVGNVISGLLHEWTLQVSSLRGQFSVSPDREQPMTIAQPTRIELLLRRAQPGKHGGVKAHIPRGQRIARAIEERWGIR